MKKVMLLALVVMLFYACDAIIEVEDISEKEVNVLAPKSGVVLVNSNVTFSWEALEDSDSYNIQVAVPNFENAQQIVVDSVVTLNHFNTVLFAGDYEWRVRAQNSSYTTKYTEQGFVISEEGLVDISNSTINIVEPEHEAIFLTTDVVLFKWNRVEGAENYQIQIASPDFTDSSDFVIDKIVSDTIFSISELPKSQYKFRVKGQNILYSTGFASIGFQIN